VLVVTARATMPDGRVDESIGALPIDKLQGEARANALMKCETKAKRRVTLSICGLGMLDESEIEGAQATDNGGSLHLSPHSGPGENPDAAPKESSSYGKCMADLAVMDREAFDPGCTWHSMSAIRRKLGRKGEPTTFSTELSRLYSSDEISPSQRKELSALWNRVDRKLTTLEGKLKPPPVEASFTDDPDDGTEALGAPSREPGEDADD
jgi:hypothetical protein